MCLSFRRPFLSVLRTNARKKSREARGEKEMDGVEERAASESPVSLGPATEFAHARVLPPGGLNEDVDVGVGRGASAAEAPVLSVDAESACKEGEVNKPSSSEEATTPPTFHQFFDLPGEVRSQILAFVFSSKKPILPHLCDKSGKHGAPKFHDDNALSHAAVHELTSVTRVSKRLRAESLPAFYAANEFAVGPDTATYFAYLASLGRFGFVRCVRFDVLFRAEKYAAWELWCVDQFDRLVERYEGDVETLERRCADSRSAPLVDTDDNADRVSQERKPLTAAELRRHPRYLVGGIGDLNLAILLRMLSTASAPTSEFASRIVLPVANPSAFNNWHRLRWFASMVEGLGMELHFLVLPLEGRLGPYGIAMEWRRRFQGQEYAGQIVAATDCERGDDGPAETSVVQRALEKFPHIDEMRRPAKTCFYRRPCHDTEPGLLRWYDMETVGGGWASS